MDFISIEKEWFFFVSYLLDSFLFWVIVYA